MNSGKPGAGEKTALIVGAGLAGCECALTLANAGYFVKIYEQKPTNRSAAHESDDFAELVCSNSLRSDERTSAIGLLKNEMRQLGSCFMKFADEARIPAGKALAVDRKIFSGKMTETVRNHENIMVEEKRINGFAELEDENYSVKILATGPMTSGGLLGAISDFTGRENCFFYDAIAPVVWTDSLNMDVVFSGSRYEEGEGDYLNCPMDKLEFERFYRELVSAETWRGRHGEEERHFEGCMPIEALAARGERTLVFGPMKPVGFVNPATGKRPWAVLQLRPESANRAACNLVGCQTKLLQKEQERVFRLVPGMEKAEFARFGSMHRNTYLNSPQALDARLALRGKPDFHVIGQLSGVEGYVESAATGLWLALSLTAEFSGTQLPQPPVESALGALLAHLRRQTANFQPSNATFGLMPELGEKIRKKERKEAYAKRAEEAFAGWLASFPKGIAGKGELSL